LDHFYPKKLAAHGDMSRRWGEALRYFKKHSYRGVLLYATTMWHVKSFFHIFAIFFWFLYNILELLNFINLRVCCIDGQLTYPVFLLYNLRVGPVGRNNV